MKITNTLKLDIPIDRAWTALNDVERVARCAPGTMLLESRSNDVHVGTVSVRLGPVSLSFRGTVTFLNRDEANYSVLARAEGNEERARGSVIANVLFTLSPLSAESVELLVESNIVLVGAVAQYGRGVALIQNTAQAIMDQFSKNLQADLQPGCDQLPLKEISAVTVITKGLWRTGKDYLTRKS